jgi:hypothetical protein
MESEVLRPLAAIREELGVMRGEIDELKRRGAGVGYGWARMTDLRHRGAMLRLQGVDERVDFVDARLVELESRRMGNVATSHGL